MGRRDRVPRFFRRPAQVLLSGDASRRWRSDDQHNMLLLAPTIAMLAWLVAQRPPARSAPLLMSGAAGTAAGGGGDLSGGNDEERNAQLASLRNMMFAAPEEAEAPGASEADSAERVGGLLLDLPLVRYSWCVLPHRTQP